MWPTTPKMERRMLHKVGHPQNASDIAKQSVGLAGHSASPHSTALVLNVSPSTAWFWTYVDLKEILRASRSGQENQFFELAQNTPMAQTSKTKVDIFTHIPWTWAQIAGSGLSAFVDELTITM